MDAHVPRTAFQEMVGIDVPIICGPMYPCSNPELVGAASAAGAIGVIQPISLTYVHGHDFRKGVRKIREIAGGRPVGFNALIEASSRVYLERMRKWVDIALEEGVRFFITALGKPDWVVEKVHSVGGVVFHDVTERKWAERGADGGVDGFICVNERAGGHAGARDPRRLYEEVADLGKPMVCAGGVGSAEEFVDALKIGYSAVQMGTRFIATHECHAHEDYKRAILDAKQKDIVLTDKLSGVPVAVIETETIRKAGTKAGPIMGWLLRHPKGKHYARMFYSLRSLWQLKRASLKGLSYRDVFQAGQSVETIDAVESVAEIVARFDAARRANG